MSVKDRLGLAADIATPEIDVCFAPYSVVKLFGGRQNVLIESDFRMKRPRPRGQGRVHQDLWRSLCPAPRSRQRRGPGEIPCLSKNQARQHVRVPERG